MKIFCWSICLYICLVSIFWLTFALKFWNLLKCNPPLTSLEVFLLKFVLFPCNSLLKIYIHATCTMLSSMGAKCVSATNILTMTENTVPCWNLNITHTSCAFKCQRSRSQLAMKGIVSKFTGTLDFITILIVRLKENATILRIFSCQLRC